MVQMNLVEGLPEELKELIVDTVEPVSSKHVNMYRVNMYKQCYLQQYLPQRHHLLT